MEIDLATLPIEHPLRNKPLVGMFYYVNGSKMRAEIFPAFFIAKKCYNELGPTWTKWDRFVAEVEDDSTTS